MSLTPKGPRGQVYEYVFDRALTRTRFSKELLAGKKYRPAEGKERHQRRTAFDPVRKDIIFAVHGDAERKYQQERLHRGSLPPSPPAVLSCLSSWQPFTNLLNRTCRDWLHAMKGRL